MERPPSLDICQGNGWVGRVKSIAPVPNDDGQSAPLCTRLDGDGLGRTIVNPVFDGVGDRLIHSSPDLPGGAS